MGQIGVELHGVTLNVSCDYEPLVDYLRDLLDCAIRPVFAAPDLHVAGTWHTGTPPHGEAGSGDTPGFGKRMQLADDELVWFNTHRDKDLQLRFRRLGAQTHFDVDYFYHPTPEKLVRYPEYEQRKFFKLVRYLVQFPAAWFLERTRGWTLVHASAVAFEDEAVLVAGPGGAGKTTTCVGLLAHPGVRLISENLLFTDGHAIFPLREPIRLTDESLALFGAKQHQALVRMPMGGGSKHKSLFRLPDSPDRRPVRPIALFIPRFTPRASLDSIAPAVASEILSAINRLTLELNDYYWYTSALDLVWPAAGHMARQSTVLARLTENTPCYALGIDRTAGVAAVVERILGHVGWSAVEPSAAGRAL